MREAGMMAKAVPQIPMNEQFVFLHIFPVDQFFQSLRYGFGIIQGSERIDIDVEFVFL